MNRNAARYKGINVKWCLGSSQNKAVGRVKDSSGPEA